MKRSQSSREEGQHFISLTLCTLVFCRLLFCDILQPKLKLKSHKGLEFKIRASVFLGCLKSYY